MCWSFKTWEKSKPTKSISTWEDRRWNGGACKPAWAARSACPWGQGEITGYTARQCTPQFAVQLSFTLLMLLDENGFAHITMVKPAEILQLVWAFLSNKCLLKIAGVESHHHTVSGLPHLQNQPAVPGTLTLHSQRARNAQTLFGCYF